MYFTVLLVSLISVDVNLDLVCFLIAQFPHPCNKVGNVKMLYIFSPVCFWTSEGFKGLLIIRVIRWNFDVKALTTISCSGYYLRYEYIHYAFVGHRHRNHWSKFASDLVPGFTTRLSSEWSHTWYEAEMMTRVTRSLSWLLYTSMLTLL